MTHLYLVRHGQTDWNVEGRWQGQADVPLNVRGRQQAAQVARALSKLGLVAIYSSDLLRARETADTLAALTGVEVQLDPRLREIHQGQWQGMLVTEIQERYGEAFQRRKDDPLNVAPPGGETVLQVKERVVDAIEDIIQQHLRERVAVVSHGFALAVIQVHYQNRPVTDAWKMIPENDEWRELFIPNHSSPS
jgi:broad specificity phosphatase PhoE